MCKVSSYGLPVFSLPFFDNPSNACLPQGLAVPSFRHDDNIDDGDDGDYYRCSHYLGVTVNIILASSIHTHRNTSGRTVTSRIIPKLRIISARIRILIMLTVVGTMIAAIIVIRIIVTAPLPLSSASSLAYQHNVVGSPACLSSPQPQSSRDSGSDPEVGPNFFFQSRCAMVKAPSIQPSIPLRRTLCDH